MAAPGATPPVPAKPVPLDEQIAAVIRECGLRARVYPGWIGKGKMKPEKAEHELAAMTAVLATLRDYQAMKPKVLALTAVSMTLARSAGLDDEGLNVMLERAEADAAHQLREVAGELVKIEVPLPK